MDGGELGNLLAGMPNIKGLWRKQNREAEMAVVTSNPPEQGQLVTVRQRQYVVSEVAKSTLPPTPLQPLDGHGQHLVTLASVEDDALGEELQVIWELEPGAAVIEDVPLPEPTGFDAPDRLDAFLDAVRWGRPRRPTCATSKPRSARASRLKITNSIR